jgi:hypothetical protein
MSSNVYMHRLAVSRSHLYGMGRDGKLYVSSTSKHRIVWKRVESAPDALVHICATYDEKYLWVQTAYLGFLIGKSGVELEVRTQMLRNYGRDRETYVEIDTRSMTASTTEITRRGSPADWNKGITYKGVSDALLTYHNEVVVVSSGRLRLIQWEPYFFESTSLRVE